MFFDSTELDTLISQFEKLGETISNLSIVNTGYFKEIEDSVKKTLDLVEKFDGKKANDLNTDSSKLKEYIGDIGNYFGVMTKDITNQSFGGLLNKAFNNLSVFSDKLKNIKSAQRGAKKAVGTTGAYAKAEFSSLKGRLRSFAHKLKIPTPGNILAGTIGMMAYGIMDEQRVRAEAGEVLNIAVKAVDSGTKSIVENTVSNISALQEKMRIFYGISREGLQQTFDTLVNGGYRLAEIQSTFSSSLGEVGKTLNTFALGVDKLYEISSGSTAKRMVEYSALYGKSGKEAANAMVDLLVAGEASGIGTLQFVKNIEEAGRSLNQLGFDITSIIDISLRLQKAFESLGVPEHLAGRQVSLGLSGIASGLANISDSWAMILGEELGYGTGIVAIQNFKDKVLRIIEGKGEEKDIEQVVDVVFTKLMNATSGNPELSRYVVENQLGWGYEGAKLGYMLYQSLKSGNKEVIEKDREALLKKLKDSFTTEKAKTTEFQLFMNEWLKSVAELGKALFNASMNALAYMIASFKIMPYIFLGLFDKRIRERNKDLFFYLKFFETGLMRSTREILPAFDKVIETTKKIGDTTIASSLTNIKLAMSLDPFSSAQTIKGIYEKNKKERQASLPQQPQIQYVPMSDSGKGASSQEMFTPSRSYYEPVTQGVTEYRNSGWVGGDLTIVSGNVDEDGSINLSVVGNCPKCGLIFGDGGDNGMQEEVTAGTPITASEKDFEAMSRMLYSEAGGKKLFTKEGRKEIAGIAYTALNRSKNRGKSLTDVITSGHGYGKQGYLRQYGTARAAEPGSEVEKKLHNFVKDLFAGKIANPVGEATSFLHYTGGAGYGTNAKALPNFAETGVNVANINNARFYAPKGKGKEARDKEALDKFYREQFELKHGGE